MEAGYTTQGYVTDTDYTWGAYSGQNPKEINTVAAMAGCSPVPLEQPFAYADLGCGNGLTLHLLAAVYPHARFIGLDFNQRHIDNAKALAAAAGARNVEFRCVDLTEAAGLDLPALDFVALHGVYTWVPKNVREAVMAFVGQRLKPTGFAYFAYNCMPGWAALAPLRQLILRFAEVVEGDTVHKAKICLSYLRLLRDNEAGYFTQNPAAMALLERLQRVSLSYIAHEFFNEAWEPIYFSEMAGDASRASLNYAGSMPLFQNSMQLMIPASLQQLFQTAPDRIVFETHKDFVTNQQFRTDIFTKQPIRREPTVTMLRQLKVGAVRKPDPEMRTLKLPVADIELRDPIYPALLALLADRAWTGAELAAHPDLVGFGEESVLEALSVLLLSRQFTAFVDDPRPQPASLPERIRFLDPMSEHVMRALPSRTGKGYAAAHATGGFVALPLAECLILASHCAGIRESERPAWLLQELGRLNEQLLGPEGQPLEGEAARAAAVQACDAYRAKTFPHCWRIGAIGAA